MSRKPTSELSKAYTAIVRKRSDYKDYKETKVLKEIDMIRGIVKSNYKLFSAFFKQKEIESLKLTEIYYEKLSLNGDICVDVKGNLQLHPEIKGKKNIYLSIQKYGISDNILALSFISTSEDSTKKTIILEGFYTDTPVEIQKKEQIVDR